MTYALNGGTSSTYLIGIMIVTLIHNSISSLRLHDLWLVADCILIITSSDYNGLEIAAADEKEK